MRGVAASVADGLSALVAENATVTASGAGLLSRQMASLGGVRK